MNKLVFGLVLTLGSAAQAQIVNGPSVPDFQSYSASKTDKMSCQGTPIGNTAFPDMGYINHAVAITHSMYTCTIANPLNLSVHIGQIGRIAVTQSTQGNDAIALGSAFITPGGKASLTFSKGAGATDYIYYDVIDASRVLVTSVLQNAIP